MTERLCDASKFCDKYSAHSGLKAYVEGLRFFWRYNQIIFHSVCRFMGGIRFNVEPQDCKSVRLLFAQNARQLQPRNFSDVDVNLLKKLIALDRIYDITFHYCLLIFK